MTDRCLSAIELMRLHSGLGAASARAHVTECARCAAAYRRLIGDLEQITGVLMDTALPRTLPPSGHRGRPWRMLAVTGAVGAMSVVIALAVQGPGRYSPAGTSRAVPAASAPFEVTRSTDPDTPVSAPSQATDERCGSDTDVAAVACQDDDPGSADPLFDVG